MKGGSGGIWSAGWLYCRMSRWTLASIGDRAMGVAIENRWVSGESSSRLKCCAVGGVSSSGGGVCGEGGLLGGSGLGESQSRLKCCRLVGNRAGGVRGDGGV